MSTAVSSRVGCGMKKKKPAKTRKKKSATTSTDRIYFAKLDKLYERFPYLTDPDLREVFLTENRNELNRKPPRNSELEARRLFDEWVKKKTSNK
jgi:hypothetical protein